jgi:hypothetical protein
MNKMAIIIGAACFVLALAGSTAVVVLRAPAKVAVADSTAVSDSTHAAAGHGEAAAHAATPAEGAHGDVPQAGATVALEGEGHAPSTEPDRMALAANVPHEGEVVPAAPTHAVEPPADYGRVAKILVNMKPAEAAAILEQLGDPQIEGVLRAVGPRQAATLLAALPTERAAQLSKRLLVPTPEEKRP